MKLRTNIRNGSSSGGLASEIITACLSNGFRVFSCSNISDNFSFVEIKSKEELIHCAGSKYVKSNFSNILREIKKSVLNNKVLFVGLPCQVAAVKNYVSFFNSNNLYTIDLVCHGTPSLKLFDLYVDEVGFDREKDISFRNKNKFRVHTFDDLQSINSADEYTLAFLNSLSYTENCYKCKFAKTERVSDLTLGDAWSSNITEEKNKGVSLVLVSSEKGAEILERANVTLHNIDFEKERSINHQLTRPSIKHKKYASFFKSIYSGKPFTKTVRKCLPFICLKQRIKRLIKRKSR